MNTRGEQLRAILGTEWRLLEPICEFVQTDEYMVYRSDRFPRYYGGNGIDIVRMGERRLADWEAVSRSYFPTDRYEHTTYTVAGDVATEEFVAEATERGYHIERTVFMAVDHTRSCRPLPDGFEIRRVESEEEWRRMQQLSEEEDADQDWYDPEYTGPNRIFEKTRLVSEAVGIEWFYIAPRGSDEMLAKLGLFTHNGIGRLQDVATALGHRRRGLASLLVSDAIRRALVDQGASMLSLAADADYHAVDLYRRLGFEEAGDYSTLMKYPVVNPAYLPQT